MKRAFLISSAFFAFVFSLLPFSAQAQTPDTTQLRSFLERRMKELRIPALSYSVVYRGKTLASYQLGSNVDSSSYFLIGSMTKSVTALAILLLVQDGLVSLDSPVSDYLPQFSFSHKGDSAIVTVRHLLNHTSGFSRIQGFQKVSEREPQTFSLAHPPSAAHAYSNINYTLLGLLLEKIGGKSIPDFFEERIFIPAGMGKTFSSVLLPERLAQGNQMLFFGTMRRNEPSDGKAMMASGGLALNADQMETYLNLMANPDSLRIKTGLSDSLRKELFRPHLNRRLGYAMGWVKREYGTDTTYTHQGLTGSYSSAMWIRPSDGLGVAVLTNSNTFGGPQEILYGSLRVMRGLQPMPIEKGEMYFRWGIFAMLAINTYQFGNQNMK